MRLQVRWRQWLVRTLISRWLADRHFYQLTIVHTEADNPEARIAEDGRLAIELLVDFSLGVLNALLAAISFIGILWVVGGSLTVAGYSIPGYMVFACILYSTITTVSMFLLGRPLVRRVEEKAAGEAQLRYELTRVKDNAENIALIGGDDDERERLDVTLSDLVQRWLGVIVWQGRMMWLNGANLVLAPVVPLLLGAPKYLSGEMTLGSLMQAATAFMQVQVALNWLADNAMRLADWFASSHRVTQLSDAIDRLEASLGPVGQGETIKLGVSPDNRMHLRHLNIALHDGKLMIDGAEAVISPGEKVLVKGEFRGGKKHAHSCDSRIVALGKRRNPRRNPDDSNHQSNGPGRSLPAGQSEEQVEGYSLDAQDRAGRLYCQTHGWEVVQVYRDEGRSARTDDLAKRPAFQQMLADAEAGLIDVVVVHKLDRFARNRRVAFEAFERLGKARVGFVSLSEQIDYSSPVRAADADDAGRPVPVLLGQPLARDEEGQSRAQGPGALQRPAALRAEEACRERAPGPRSRDLPGTAAGLPARGAGQE